MGNVKTYVLTIFAVFLSSWLSAQELNCSVSVNSSQIEGTYKQMFSTLENALSEFINTQKWTEARFSNVEKIDCSVNITIKGIPQQDNYSAEITVQSRRPAFNSAYTTATLNWKDSDFEFSYVENEPLQYNEYTMESNLIAVISYYIYMIIGVDFDSYSPRGGEPYFRMAQNIVTISQSSSTVGWKAFESTRNRHALVNGFLEESTSAMRQLWYEYHRQGLDAMVQNVDKGRSVVTRSLNTLLEIKKANSTSALLSFFLDSKLDELINVYSKAPMKEKEEIYNLLADIYPAYTSRLSEIKKETK